MIKITVKQLQNLNACQEGIDWFIKSKKTTLKTIIPALLKADHVDYANWLLSRLMTNAQRIQWAIYSAETVLLIFESSYPTDNRPRLAIQAAKDFLAGKITADVAYTAYAAIYAAANAANATNAAAYAAYAANAAVYAANAAVYAANAAVYAATYAANATDAATELETNKKILAFGLKLLGEK